MINFYVLTSLLCAATLFTSCGRDSSKPFSSSGPENNPPTQEQTKETPWNSYSVASSALLPKCDGTKFGALAFVRSDKKFYTCDGVSWQAEDILPKDSFAIVDKWKFHVDSYQGETNLVEAGYEFLTNIGDVEIVRHANGTASYHFSGAMIDDTESGEVYNENFSYSGIITDTSKQFQKIYKFRAYSNMRLRISINLSGTTPTFAATVDADGNFSNNIDRFLTLSKE